VPAAKSENVGCDVPGTPAVEIELIHRWAVAASDSTPPSVEAVGAGKRPAGKVPEEMFDAFVVSVVAEGAGVEPLISVALIVCALNHVARSRATGSIALPVGCQAYTNVWSLVVGDAMNALVLAEL
jgi:hypothetical protein